ncbi:hypothetical protein CcCBS67573_g05548 [Chytriomyces confervae]|uniref:Ceramidase n=1 Tax=Chytriomyces confervae TaxID=246404 RepID=A0A507FC88_9FUNG|nr:hypothetical protein CcCBS67573_g05548 [Chytriomyces confervae]
MGYSYWTGGVAAKDGVWGPVTSTLDWCEENYVLTPYVAELWNSTSNVFFLLLAWLAVINLQAVGANEVRNYIAIWSLIVVAVGSILFHGTLWYSYQMLDELPMIYNACILLFCALQIYPESRHRKLAVGLALSAYSAAVTSIYLAIKNPEFLALSHGTLAVYLIYLLTTQIQRMPKTCPQHASKIHSLWTLHKWGLVSYFCGFVVWSIDNNFCSALRQARELVGTPFGFIFEFHVWWHLFAACGGYGVILLVAYMRLLAVGRGEVELVWFMQRSHQAEVRAKLEEQHAKTVSEAQWVLDGDGVDREAVVAPVRFEVDGSYLSFTEAPIVGRKSFKSFNAEIEALAETQESEQRSLRSTLIEGRESISEAEMVSRFKKLKNPNDQAETTNSTAAAAGKKSTGKKRKQDKNDAEAEVDEGKLVGSENGTAQRFKFIKPAVETPQLRKYSSGPLSGIGGRGGKGAVSAGTQERIRGIDVDRLLMGNVNALWPMGLLQLVDAYGIAITYDGRVQINQFMLFGSVLLGMLGGMQLAHGVFKPDMARSNTLPMEAAAKALAEAEEAEKAEEKK